MENKFIHFTLLPHHPNMTQAPPRACTGRIAAKILREADLA
jgi:hypothetical protein